MAGLACHGFCCPACGGGGSLHSKLCCGQDFAFWPHSSQNICRRGNKKQPRQQQQWPNNMVNYIKICPGQQRTKGRDSDIVIVLIVLGLVKWLAAGTMTRTIAIQIQQQQQKEQKLKQEQKQQQGRFYCPNKRQTKDLWGAAATELFRIAICIILFAYKRSHIFCKCRPNTHTPICLFAYTTQF